MFPERSVFQRSATDLGATTVTPGGSDAAALLPCVSYQCTSSFVATAVSANSLELIGIGPENILGKRTLWDERLRSADHDRLVAILNRLAWTEMGSMVHKIANDRGSRILVAHGFRKVMTADDFTIQGGMVPLSLECETAALNDSAVPQFIHKIGNHFQLINLLIGSLKRTGTNTDEIDTLQLTVDRAVEFTRAFSHYNQPPVFAPAVDLGEILQAVIESVAPYCVDKQVGLKRSALECLNGAMITGDAYLLELAFTALLQNALDATQSGSQIVVSGRIAKKNKDSSTGRIAIADNGSGMDKNMLAKAAEPFITSKRDRDGLGLSTASRIVESHGGQLRLSSAPGKGTKVEVTLPLTFYRRASDL